MAKKLIVIGSGFAGLSAASFMARAGWEVTVVEKQDGPGGRARQLEAAGFRFDMGPSWYWMPDVFERYFAAFGKKVSDYYRLQRLDPSYRVYWQEGFSDIPASLPAFKAMLEQWEPGAARRLDTFLEEAHYKYRTGMQKLVFKPGRSLTEFLDWSVIKGVFRLDLLGSMKAHIHQHFRHPRIRQLLEFPILFLGALPENTPALYSLMNYADIVGGTWYPEGGMYSVVTGMYTLARELGVQFRFNEEVTAIHLEDAKAREVQTTQGRYPADVVIGGADYHFIETSLLPPSHRSYSTAYWEQRLMAPSCLLYYVGLNKKLPGIRHHMLFFDSPFDLHAQEIYTSKEWPSNPLFYVSAPSVTDPAVAPAGQENLFFLIPVAAGLTGDDEALRERYFQDILHRFEQRIGLPVADAIVYRKSFAVSDFVHEYNSFKGNAYGLANTLRQTALLKPSCRSRKISNLFYTGQLTVPGPGVPPSLISGEVVAGQVLKHFKD
ncbi:MAG: phytoene desaturase family protein [Candidatus Pseudobacter hemicellulosilyticus]|uniref:Phytoene desaturase family protein n=1 Tax=Candidatus Pseudobacter hemicellulosilyticus TaxID=3121375 RepID=A0AAJ6BHQ8_9BACT|nr:MAG: phytoene desaturase family protein [Pseudobacter sp.]